MHIPHSARRICPLAITTHYGHLLSSDSLGLSVISHLERELGSSYTLAKCLLHKGSVRSF